MDEDRFCKKCSVTRVHALIKAYGRAHTAANGGRHLSGLRAVADLARQRGFAQGGGLLAAGLGEQELRALCWNVSSFLKDEELERLLDLPGAKD